jgi:DNA-damage-inducible protein J
MTKTAMIRARVDPDLKEDAERVFNALGLSATQAITLELRVPNEVTLKVFEQTDAGQDLVHCKDVNDMSRRLGI